MATWPVAAYWACTAKWLVYRLPSVPLLLFGPTCMDVIGCVLYTHFTADRWWLLRHIVLQRDKEVYVERIGNWFLESTCQLCANSSSFRWLSGEEREWILKFSITVYYSIACKKQLVKPGMYQEYRLCCLRGWDEKMCSLEVKIEAGVDWDAVWRVLCCIASVRDCSHEATIHSRLTLARMTNSMLTHHSRLKPSQDIPRNLCRRLNIRESSWL